MPNVLIDTSAWIEFFRPEGDVNYQNQVSQLIEDNEAAICGLILVELLRGARSDKEYRELNDRLNTLHYLPTPETTWRTSGQLASQLLRKGVQIPTVDLTIAVIAIENNLPIFHHDKHFGILEKHSRLKTYTSYTRL